MYPFLGGSDTRLIVVNITPTGLTIDGHAGYAKTGNDIICAAVSALAQNLVSSIEALTRDKILCQVKDGHMDIKWENLSPLLWSPYPFYQVPVPVHPHPPYLSS